MLRNFLIISFLCFTIVDAKEEKYELSQYVYESISKAQELIDNEKNKEAKELLQKLTNASSIRTKIDKAYVRFYLGYFYMTQEKSEEAIILFKEALSYEALPKEQVKSIYLNTMQLYLVQEKYKNALVSLEKLLKLEEKVEYYIYKAQISLSIEEYRDVIESIEYSRKFQKPKSEWLQMQFYAYYMLHNYTKAQLVLQELIVLKPYKKEYWMQLFSLYALKENDNKALASLESAFIAKINLSEQEILQLVSLLRNRALPFHAAKVLEDTLKINKVQETPKTLQLLAELYFEAKNYNASLSSFLKVADQDPSGKLDLKIARIYLLEHNYIEAAQALENSLKKPSHKYKKECYELLGKTYFELNKYEKAKENFRKLLGFVEAKKTANAWLNYLGSL